MRNKRSKTNAIMISDSPRDSPRKKKTRTVSASKSPGSSEVDQYSGIEMDYLRNQMAVLQGISTDDPIYELTFHNVVTHLKKRPPFKTVQGEEGGKRFTWDVPLADDIHYRYEMIEMGNEVMMRCMYWAMGRFVEIMNLRLSPNVSPVLHVHNVGYIPLSLHGSQFSHHFFAFEYFVRILYSVEAIWKRRKVLSQHRTVVLQTLPENPLNLRVEVMINVPSSTFATEMQPIDVGTLKDMLFANPKYPTLKGGKRRLKKQ